jgi:predicted amidohydrolase YtcJ
MGSSDTASGSLTRRRFLQGSAAAAGSVLLGARPATARSDGPADLVLTNGYVWTLDPSRPVARAIAIRDGRITYVGGPNDVADHIGRATEVIDLAERMVMPGIHDGHIHPISGGRNLSAPGLDYEQLTIPEFLDRMADIIKATQAEEPDTWLVVGEWDAVAMGTLPTRDDLDGLPTARPILVIALDGHSALANSRALKLAGITAATPDPPDGEIVRDPNGRPTGILIDGAIGLVTSVVPPPTDQQRAGWLKAAVQHMNAMGITSYLDASADASELAAMALLSDAGDLTIRAQAAVYVAPGQLDDPDRLLRRLRRLQKTYERPGLTIATIKLFFDGVIEYPTQTAALIDPYRVNTGTPNDPHWVPGTDDGPTYIPQRLANRGIAALDAAGWQVHAHAIGDRAVRSALDSFAVAAEASGSRGRRHTIAHLELIHPDDYARFRQLGVMANMQLQWAERDTYTMDYLRPYIGRRRWRRLYPAGSLWDAGARVCGGSDWPVDPLLPFRQIEMGVNRIADEVYGGYPYPLNPEQGLALRASIAMHTKHAAFQLHQETRTGSLRPGMAADLVVLDRNLFEVPLRDVSTTQVLMTLVRGDVVHLSPDLV